MNDERSREPRGDDEGLERLAEEGRRLGTSEVEALDILEIEIEARLSPPPLPKTSEAPSPPPSEPEKPPGEPAEFSRAEAKTTVRKRADRAGSSTADGLEQLGVEQLGSGVHAEFAAALEELSEVEPVSVRGDAGAGRQAATTRELRRGQSAGTATSLRSQTGPRPRATPAPEPEQEPGAPCYVALTDRIVWHRLDYREAALLALMDGTKDRDKVIEMAELDVETGRKLIDALLERGLIAPKAKTSGA